MTDKQPEALRLADKYAERYHDYRMRATHETEHDLKVFRNALESELRRLHEENQTLKRCLFQMQEAAKGQGLTAAKAQGDNNGD